MTPFKSGDRVVIFNSSDPDDALERIVGRVTKNTIRLKGDAPASSWSSNGRHKYFESVRLLRPEDLPAAQEEARREKADRAAFYAARLRAMRLATQITGIPHGCETAAEVRDKVAEVLRAALAEWGVPQHCPGCQGGRGTRCQDPQCGDSTWDHDCTAGYENCPGIGQ